MSFSTYLTAADRIRAKSAIVYETADQRRISVEQARANVDSPLEGRWFCGCGLWNLNTGICCGCGESRRNTERRVA